MIDDKIKIIRIISRLNVGGPSFHTILLTAYTDKNRFDSKLIRGLEEPGEGKIDYLVKAKSVKSILIPEMGREVRIWKNLKACFKIYKILKREKPDIVHTHLAMAGFLGRTAAIIAGSSKIVHTFHGHTLHGYWGKLKTNFFASLEKMLARRSDCLIAVSDRVRNDIINAGIAHPDKTITVHLGLELKRFRELDKYKGQLRKELGIDNETVLVGIIARLVPVKNHRLFIEAASKVNRKNVKYIIVGDGQLRAELEELAENTGISEDIIFTGFRNDLEKIYSDLDISVLSSLNEGLPVAVIESMTAGVPVISTDVGGIHELIDDGENGFIVPSGDVEGLTNRLKNLIVDSNLRNELGESAISKVYPYLEYTRLVSDLEDLYSCLVDNKPFKHLHMRGFRNNL
ncbi:MAG: glycosyltransferase family 4 protein [candidate division Zixibacteria bacterium]|nr:glycosyltransferase family 4 protein [candidate division Zixibacteria bacterium]